MREDFDFVRSVKISCPDFLTFIDHIEIHNATEDVRKKDQKKGKEKHRLYLRKAFFVDMIHHDNFIVECSTGPSRAEPEEHKNRSDTTLQ